MQNGKITNAAMLLLGNEDYDFSKRNQVDVTVYEKIIDENYSRVLFDNPEFDIETVLLIDLVQKHKSINKDAVRYLRKLGIIEGKMPNVYIPSKIAESLDEKAQYVKNKAFDEEYYCQLILKYLKEFGKASRNDIRKLLIDKLPDVLNEKQKENKIKNILYSMGKKNLIERDGSNSRTSKWQLKK